MATAQSYQAELPDVSTPSAGVRSDGFSETGQDFGSKFVRFFGGEDIAQQYQNMLTENNRAYEQALLREQRAYEQYLRDYQAQREDTAIQRHVKDLKAAGINPYYALQGGLSGASAQYQPASDSSGYGSSSAKARDKDNTAGLAAVIAGVAKIIASML